MDVSEGRPVTGERLDLEADSAAILANLVGDEAADLDALLAQKLRQPRCDGRLADTGPPLEEDSQRRGRVSRRRR
jgi:hypothetical protein